mmetsp:Transcript_3476/g.21825  ORF Transcript_3476/g.21825 Transcript_3476/m.21825 type:complete len:243 (-) Transcript_3476:794-1522(-)
MDAFLCHVPSSSFLHPAIAVHPRLHVGFGGEGAGEGGHRASILASSICCITTTTTTYVDTWHHGRHASPIARVAAFRRRRVRQAGAVRRGGRSAPRGGCACGARSTLRCGRQRSLLGRHGALFRPQSRSEARRRTSKHPLSSGRDARPRGSGTWTRRSRSQVAFHVAHWSTSHAHALPRAQRRTSGAGRHARMAAGDGRVGTRHAQERGKRRTCSCNWIWIGRRRVRGTHALGTTLVGTHGL